MRQRQDRKTHPKREASCRECGRSGLWRLPLARRCRPLIAIVALGIGGIFGLDRTAEAWAQAPRPEAEAPPPRPVTALGADEALSMRYRFLEKYGVEQDPSQPDVLTEYQVGIRETLKSVREKPQGAPDRVEWSTTTVYTERAAKVDKTGDLSDAVRRYENFNQKGMVYAESAKAPLFKDLSVWISRGSSGSPPQILSLPKDGKDRPLREAEFDMMISQASLPPLKALLPKSPCRVGDTWKVSLAAMYYLFGEMPDPEGADLQATLNEINKAESGSRLVAVIGISGELKLSEAPTFVNGEIAFAFEPPPAAVPRTDPASERTTKPRNSLKTGKEGVVDARGWIKQVKFAWRSEFPDPESDGRLRTTETHELFLVRRLLTEIPSQPGKAPPTPITLPNPPPVATEANSWLVYEDPEGRFQFRHPQQLQVARSSPQPNTVELADQRPEAGINDVFMLQLPPGTDDVDADRRFHSLDSFKRLIDVSWPPKNPDVVRGPEGWLPEANWAPLKVYRKEIGVKTQPQVETRKVDRIYVDYYFVLTNHNQCLHAQSMTIRNDHVAFRTDAEHIIKSIQFGPAKLGGSQPKTPAATTTPPPPIR